jgi:hypothetical protein
VSIKATFLEVVSFELGDEGVESQMRRKGASYMEDHNPA